MAQRKGQTAQTMTGVEKDQNDEEELPKEIIVVWHVVPDLL
jgi:hypothetical protein